MEKEIGKEINSSLAIFENIIYLGTLENQIIALSKDTGEILWDFQTKGR